MSDPGESPSAYEPPVGTTNDALRRRAVQRLEDRRGLQAHVLAYVLVNGFLVAIWAMNDGGFFWPVFPILGWGIGLAFHVWAIVSPEPSEDKIQQEMRRLSGE